MNANGWPFKTRNAFAYLGRRGAAMVGVCVALALLLAAVEYALAFAFVFLLYALHLMDAASLPARLVPLAARASTTAVWVALIVVVVVRALVTIANYAARAMLAEGTHARMQMALAYRVLMSEDGRTIPLSEMSLYTGDVFPKATESLLRFAQASASILQAAVLGIGTFVLTPGAAAVALAGTLAAGIGMRRLNRMTNRIGHRVQSAREDLERTKVRVSRNRFLIRVFGIEESEYFAWLRTAFAYFRNNTFAYVLGHLAGALMPAFSIALVVGIVVINGRVFHAPAADLVAFFYLFYRAQQLLANSAMNLGGLAWYEPQATRAKELILSLSPVDRTSAMRPEFAFRLDRSELDLPGLRRTATIPSRGAVVATPPAITLRDVTFSWGESEQPVLRDLSLDVPSGTQLAIVGPNGSGKSTLLALLLAVLRPDRGHIAIDALESREWMRLHPGAVAYVGPEPYLIHGSVRDNLLYGGEPARSDEGIWDALAAVGLVELFRSLPAGLDYVLEENGDGLSSGQKQRIAIARGFLRGPSLFVMDEPSANLDAESEARILDALGALKGRCTVVLVTHRPAMLRGVDRLLELEPMYQGAST